MRQWGFKEARVWLVWAKMVWLRHLEYRFNTLTNVFGSLFWLAGTVFTYWVIFQRVPKIAGWSWEQMLVLYGVYNLWWGAMVTFFNGGLLIGHRIRFGGLDRFLLYPGSDLVYVTMKFEPELIPHFLVGGAILALSLAKTGFRFSLGRVALFAFLFLCALLLAYFVAVILGSTAFWIVENQEINDLFWLWETLGKYPAEIFSPWRVLYWAVHTVLPVVFVAVVPTKALLGQISRILVGGSILITVFAGILANFIWKKGLEKYTGVSV